MSHALRIVLVAAFLLLTSCAPGKRLTFPAAPLTHEPGRLAYATQKDGRADFAILSQWPDAVLAYDDNHDGHDDRLYHLSNFDPQAIPHVVIMLDSIPWRLVKARYDRGDWPWFGPPAKSIPPFPNMSELVFGSILHAPPQPAMVQDYYDRTAGRTRSLFPQQLMGRRIAMEELLDYHAEFKESGLTFLWPRHWFAAELARAAEVINRNPRPLTLVYLYSAAAMVCRYGEPGANEVLDGMTRLCLQLLHQRQGAIRITVLADHGHTFIPPQMIDLSRALGDAGFHMTDHLQTSKDVIIDQGGLVNYVGMHTQSPEALSQALAQLPHAQFTAFLQGNRVIVRNAMGAAAIEARGARFRYEVIDHDVLDYLPVLAKLADKADEEGFIDAADWLSATAEHQYPYGVVRLWQSFHGLVINPPDVALVLDESACAGVKAFTHFITMQSTHGSLDARSSVSFVMTTGQPLPSILPSEHILDLLEPAYVPMIRRR